MVSVADKKAERLMRVYRNQGMQRQYENEVVGLNNRMTDIHAAIGPAQLTKVDAWTKKRQDNAAFLSANLEAVTPPPTLDSAKHVFHQYTIRVTDDRDGFAATLKDDFNAGSAMFYPVPNHRLTSFRAQVDLPKTERATPRVLVVAGASNLIRRRPRTHRDRRQHRRKARCLR